MPLTYVDACNLQTQMGTNVPLQPSVFSSLPNMGIEIEVLRSHLICDLVGKALQPIKVPVSKVNEEYLSEGFKNLERKYLALCRKTRLYLERGNDGLWEFIIPPTRDYQLLGAVIQILIESGCIPKQALHRGYSMHLTIGEMNRSRDTYYLLSMLEMYFSSAARLSQPGWQKKSVAGMRDRFGLDVCGYKVLTHGDKKAVEMRSLCLSCAPEKVAQMFSLIAALVEMYQNRDDVMYQGPSFRQAQMFLVKQFENVGLPDENWGNPFDNPKVWEVFIENFNTISTNFRSFFDKVNLNC